MCEDQLIFPAYLQFTSTPAEEEAPQVELARRLLMEFNTPVRISRFLLTDRSTNGIVIRWYWAKQVRPFDPLAWHPNSAAGYLSFSYLVDGVPPHRPVLARSCGRITCFVMNQDTIYKSKEDDVEPLQEPRNADKPVVDK